MTDEPEQSPYYLAAHFRNEQQAETEYFRIQRYLRNHSADLELSVYRFQLPGRVEGSIVAVLGDDPGEQVGRRLGRALSTGETISLDEPTLQLLQERREMGRQQGNWVERHYRPGRGYKLDR